MRSGKRTAPMTPPSTPPSNSAPLLPEPTCLHCPTATRTANDRIAKSQTPPETSSFLGRRLGEEAQERLVLFVAYVHSS